VSEAPTPISLPRDIAPGIFWLGICKQVPGGTLHSYSSVYFVVGEQCSAIMDGGVTGEPDVILAQIATLDGLDFPEVKYVFPTHSEAGHAGGLGKFLRRFPSAVAHGDVSDLHLVFPDYAHRLEFADPGERFDLGGTEIVVVEAVFRDLVHSRWFFDTKRRVLFPGDGFAYTHYHTSGACGHLAEEVPELDLAENMATFALAAFHWAQFVDIEPFIERLHDLVLVELGAQVLAPTHGLVIGDPALTLPRVWEGLRSLKQPAR
jgi:flavorubredoxin